MSAASVAGSVLRGLYWTTHVLVTWLMGLSLFATGTLLTSVSGTFRWGFLAAGIAVILLGEISRRQRPPRAPLTARTPGTPPSAARPG
jgi:hypothetical protein